MTATPPEAKIIASGGVAVVVNSSNFLENLTLEQLKALYGGETVLCRYSTSGLHVNRKFDIDEEKKNTYHTFIKEIP